MSHLERLKALARYSLWLAYAHCDLVHDEYHVERAREKAKENGISNIEEANEFLESFEPIITVDNSDESELESAIEQYKRYPDGYEHKYYGAIVADALIRLRESQKSVIPVESVPAEHWTNDANR